MFYKYRESSGCAMEIPLIDEMMLYTNSVISKLRKLWIHNKHKLTEYEAWWVSVNKKKVTYFCVGGETGDLILNDHDISEEYLYLEARLKIQVELKKN